MSSKSLFELVADPVRLSILRTLADRGGRTLEELAAAAGVHSNTLRRHVDELEREGALVRSQQSRTGRGRPRVLYALAQGWSPDGESTGLAELLAGLIQRLEPSRSRVTSFGHTWGAYLAERPGKERPEQAAVGALESLGFDVEAEAGAEIRLRGCPCPLVSPGDPGLVCALACAVADGAYRAAGENGRVRALAHDPKRRSCALAIVPAA
jgi:predicted ArsR family transcriptional regulator